jgi:hypothetical protein
MDFSVCFQALLFHQVQFIGHPAGELACSTVSLFEKECLALNLVVVPNSKPSLGQVLGTLSNIGEQPAMIVFMAALKFDQQVSIGV